MADKKKAKSAIAILSEAANLLHSAKYFTRTEVAFKNFDKSEAELRGLIVKYRNYKDDKKVKHQVNPDPEGNTKDDTETPKRVS